MLKITDAAPDWQDTHVGFTLAEIDGETILKIEHLGWSEDSDHFRSSSFCWAMYLRIMKRYVEFGETVEYGRRLET